MTTAEQKPAPMRKLDREELRHKFAELKARDAALTKNGQRLMARIRQSSKYHDQGEAGALFPVCIASPGDYCVQGGPGSQYRLQDVDLFAVYDDRMPPTQITFESK